MSRVERTMCFTTDIGPAEVLQRGIEANPAAGHLRAVEHRKNAFAHGSDVAQFLNVAIKAPSRGRTGRAFENTPWYFFQRMARGWTSH